MKRVLALILLTAAVLSAVSCSESKNGNGSTGQNNAGSSVSNGGVNNGGGNGDGNSRELRDITLGMTAPEWLRTHLSSISTEFSKAHPNVTFNFSTYNHTDILKHREQMRFPIMAGRGFTDDIVEAQLFTPWDHLRHDWMFVDLFEMMDNDADLIMDDYYANVFEGLTVNGKLNEFPTYFTYLVIGISNDAPADIIESFKQYSAIAFSELFELYFSIPDKGDRYICDHIDAHMIFLRNLSAFVDFENRTCSIDSPRFIKLITDAKNATDPEKIRSGMLGREGDFNWKTFRSEADVRDYSVRNYFHVVPVYGYQFFIQPDGEEVFTHFIPLLNENRKIGILTDIESWGIYSASENKEVAWDFIKFMSSPEANADRIGSGASVNFFTNKSFFRSSMRQILKSYVEGSVKHRNAPFHDFSKDLDGNIEKVIDRLDEYNSMPMEWYWLWDASFPGFVSDLMRAFYADSMTAEQIASELQNRVSLLLME